MSRLHTYFSRAEFACKCGCGFDVVDAELLQVLIEIRTIYGPVHILSGCRCKKHNEAIGGAEKSQHLTGKAADFLVRDEATLGCPEEIRKYLENWHSNEYGIGVYPSWIHLDVRPDKARW